MAKDFASITQVAAGTPYDNTASGLTSTNVNGALDELKSLIGAAAGTAAGLKGWVQYRGNTTGSFDANAELKWSDIKTALTIGADPGNLNNIGLAITRSLNSFIQSTIQNTNSGTNASTDIVPTNDLGDDNGYYADFGINSSGYNDPAYPISVANDSYLYCVGGHLTVGTADRQFGTGTLKDLILHTGGYQLADERLRFKDAVNAKDASAELKCVLVFDKNTTANRPTTPVEGMCRYNTTTTAFEFYEGGAWVGLGGNTTASNIGTGAGTIFKQKTGNTLELKTLSAGTNITIQNNTNEIVISATGVIASGITNYYINAQTLFQTTSAIFVVVTGMTVTPIAGLYAIWANFSGNTSTANKVITMAIFKNAVAVSDSERETLAASASQNVQQATQTVVQFNGSESCDLRVKVSGGTLSITNRSLILIKVG